MEAQKYAQHRIKPIPKRSIQRKRIPNIKRCNKRRFHNRTLNRTRQNPSKTILNKHPS